MKKIIWGLFVFLLLGASLFIRDIQSNIQENIDDENTVVTLQFSSWGSKTELDIIQKMIRIFERENPDIKIDFLHIPQNYFQKIHLLFASNKAPDVIFLNNQYLPIYANARRLEPLECDSSLYDEKVIKALSWNEKCYAVPRDISLLVIYYNKELFDKAGVEYPKFGWTQKQMVKKAMKIKKNTGAWGISFEEEPLFYLPYVMSEGGSFFDLEDKKTQKALKNYANLRKRREVAPTRADVGSATMAQMFLQGKLAMHLSGRWITPKYLSSAKFAWEIVGFPAGTKGAVTPLDASGWAISKTSQHKKEAERFVRFLASKRCITQLAETGLIVPARKDVDFWGSEVYEEVLKTAQPTPVSVNYNKVLDRLKIKLEQLFN